MKTTHGVLLAAVTAAVGLVTLQANAGPAAAPSYESEKCFGVAAGGKNDCQTATNSCAGSVARAMTGDAWIYVPKGLCEKISGGSLQPKQG